MKSGPDDAGSLMLELSRKEAARARLESELAAARAALARPQPASALSDADMRRLALLEKERGAISAIMEGKIAKLVDQISAGVTAGLPEAIISSQPKWLRELSALDRLVKASVRALSAGAP